MAKVFIPRYSSFPITHNVHHGKIQELATNVAILNSLEALQGAREVVQGELPGIGHAKGIDEVLDGDLFHNRTGVVPLNLRKRPLF